MSNFGLIIEGLVAVLLVLTIAYCFRLNRRLMRLKADEQTLKATISELITATEIAERAIAGLKLTVQECDQTLGQRLKYADLMAADLGRQVAAGDDLLKKVAQIASAARSKDLGQAQMAVAPDAQATVAAAQAFASRTRMRSSGLAA